MAAADAGQHGGDMPVTDVERLADLTVAPGDSRQPPLEGGDRKLGAAALDLGREVEADRLGIGRRLGQALAAQPGGEHFPVGGVGAPGVVGLRRAGVGLGGLRQAGQSAAEPAGRQEQGRGVRAGSLGLRRRAFRLPAVRAVPDASVTTALRVGWRAGVGRGGAAVGADPRARAGALGAAASAPRRRARRGSRLGPEPAALRFPTPQRLPAPRPGWLPVDSAGRPGPAPGRLVSPPCRPRAGKGGAGEGAPAAADPDASLADASARFPGSGKERRFGFRWPGAWGAADRRPAPNKASGTGKPSLKLAARTTFSDASAASQARLRSVFGASRGPQG